MDSRPSPSSSTWATGDLTSAADSLQPVLDNFGHRVYSRPRIFLVNTNNMRNADLAVLGLLMEQPRHGYQIEQVIQERNMRDWTEIGFSSIYAILGRLLKQGHLQAPLRRLQARLQVTLE